MLPKEILLKTLRLNLIPSPRVISPGPATKFPVSFIHCDGREVVVGSLKEAKSISASLPDGGFFLERLPISRYDCVSVSGYRASAKNVVGDASALAIRAAYCLGFDRATVEIGSGKGGSWVTDVRPGLDSPAAPADPSAIPEFLGARAEYLRLDPETGRPEHRFHALDVSVDGKVVFPPDAAADPFTWVSSPMPFPEMPLTTRLMFRGKPEPSFIHLLDHRVAVLGMLASPAEEARERHATDEGLLGSVRQLEGGVFEYLPVPSLLRNPAALRDVMVATSELCASARPWGPGPEALYKAQRAYYNADKAFFAPSGQAADVPGSGEGLDDFRAAWGLVPPEPPMARPDVEGSCGGPTARRLPVLGIMSPVEEGPRPFGIETDRFKEIIRTASSQGVLAYVFFPDGAGGLPAKAWQFRERRGWFATRVPAPDVVYDRHIPDVLPAGSILDVARMFQEAYPGVKFVNSLEMVRACRDKFRAHSILSADPFVAPYLPETILAECPESVAAFASRRRRTYLKLRGGTGSRGLTLIEKSGGHGAKSSCKVLRRQPDGSQAESIVNDEAQLQAVLAGIPLREYIAQDGIDLARAPGLGEVFEVRVICQKGGAGVWLRTGMVCRLNPAQGRFIIPREELHIRVDDLLGAIFPGRVAAIKDEIRELARRIPPVIEAASGPGGEMSVDIGIDTCGRPHLIEVNSKPATLFRDIAAFGLRHLSLLRIVNYAIRLSGEE